MIVNPHILCFYIFLHSYLWGIIMWLFWLCVFFHKNTNVIHNISLDRHKQVQYGGLHFLWYGKHAWLEPEGRKKVGTVECVCVCVLKWEKFFFIISVFFYLWILLIFLDIQTFFIDNSTEVPLFCVWKSDFFP